MGRAVTPVPRGNLPGRLARVGTVGEQSLVSLASREHDGDVADDERRTAETPQWRFGPRIGREIVRPLQLACPGVEAIENACGARRVDSPVGESRCRPRARA